MRKLLCVLALVSALACPVLAGEIHTPGVTLPTEEPAAEREIPTPTLAEVVLNLFTLF